jgi:predicted PurR-regulated permease PerM
MSYLILLSENPAFIVIITIFALLILFLGFVGLNLLIKLNRLESLAKNIRNDSSDTAEGLINFSLRWDDWTKNFEKFVARNAQNTALIEQIRSEQEVLTKSLGNDNKLSKAIELARSGATADEITYQAGIGADEAAAVVKFHGPKQVD